LSNAQHKNKKMSKLLNLPIFPWETLCQIDKKTDNIGKIFLDNWPHIPIASAFAEVCGAKGKRPQAYPMRPMDDL